MIITHNDDNDDRSDVGDNDANDGYKWMGPCNNKANLVPKNGLVGVFALADDSVSCTPNKQVVI